MIDREFENLQARVTEFETWSVHSDDKRHGLKKDHDALRELVMEEAEVTSNHDARLTQLETHIATIRERACEETEKRQTLTERVRDLESRQKMNDETISLRVTHLARGLDEIEKRIEAARHEISKEIDQQVRQSHKVLITNANSPNTCREGYLDEWVGLLEKRINAIETQGITT